MSNRKYAEEISVREAATVLQRHPETIRRWVWTGRLAARRQGNRLLLDRAQLAAVAAETPGGGRIGLKDWADQLKRRAHDGGDVARSTGAADLVIGDREARSHEHP